jgi:hypothetical protein
MVFIYLIYYYIYFFVVSFCPILNNVLSYPDFIHCICQYTFMAVLSSTISSDVSFITAPLYIVLGLNSGLCGEQLACNIPDYCMVRYHNKCMKATE